MTFLYDPQILQELIKATQPIKRAQVLTDPVAIRDLAAKLVNNLDKTQSITSNLPNTGLYGQDLRSLDQLIAFLKNNQMQYQGKNIVVPNYGALDTLTKELYVPYYKDAGGISATSTGQTVGIYKEGLVAYLQSIKQKMAGTVQEGLANRQISQLIDEANTTLKLNIDPQALETSPVASSPAQPEQGKEQGAGVNQPVSYQTTDTAGTPHLTPQGQKAASILISNGPFLGGWIDLPRIGRWLTNYQSLLPQLKTAQPSTLANIQSAQQKAQYLISTYNIARQSLAQNANAVVATLYSATPGDHARKTNAANAFLNQLKDLVNVVAAILTDFKGDVYDDMPEALREELDQQIGEGSSSFYNIAIDKINEWLSDLPQALQSLQQQGFYQ